MSHLMRKYQRPILWAILVLIILAFGVLGTFSPLGGGAPEMEREDEIIARVGNQVVTRYEYARHLNAAAERQRAMGREDVGFEELAEDGTADEILESLVTAKLVAHVSQETDFHFTRDFLVEQLKQDPSFQDEDGNFDAALWNSWVEMNKNRDWNTTYDEVARQVRQRLYAMMQMASARVLETEVREAFEDQNTQIRVRYALVEPPVEPTEEEIVAYYNGNPDRYQSRPDYKVAHVTVSLTPPVPGLASELVERARADADFAELAREYSKAADAERGGDMGWLTESVAIPEYRRVIFQLPVGGVSDPVQFGSNYFIFKVEDERTDEVTGESSVHARQIMIPAELSEEERAEREARAEAILAEALQAGDLYAAAQAHGLEAEESGFLNDPEPGIPATDLFTLRQAVTGLDVGDIPDVIAGRQNLYVVQVLEVKPEETMPLEDVRNRVRQDVINQIKRSEEYQAQLDYYAEQIEAQANSLQEAKALFPELDLNIEMAEPFSVESFRYGTVFWNPRAVYEAVGRAEPGAFGGPVRNVMGGYYFVELVERIPPSEEDWEEKWPEEKARLREQLLNARKSQRFEDFVTDLQERALVQVPVSVNMVAKARLLGTLREDEPVEDELPPLPPPVVDPEIPLEVTPE